MEDKGMVIGISNDWGLQLIAKRPNPACRSLLSKGVFLPPRDFRTTNATPLSLPADNEAQQLDHRNRVCEHFASNVMLLMCIICPMLCNGTRAPLQAGCIELLADLFSICSID
jgi:hypothetical protein